MVSTLDMITDIELDDYTVQTDDLSVEDNYATTPMVAIQPLYEYPDEEEFYASFEKAISDRLLAVQERLSRISTPMLSTQEVQCDTHPYESPRTETLQPVCAPMPLVVSRGESRLSLFGIDWQRVVIFACFTLMCILIGFDLMGLLVLHMR